MATTDPGGADPPREGEGERRTVLGRVFEWTAFVVLLSAAAFSLVAVPLAMLGWFFAWTLFPVWLFVAAAIGCWVRTPPFSVTASTGACATVACVIVVVGALGIAFPTQHFATNRDPGVYSATGIWLASEGSLLVDTGGSQFGDAPGVVPNGGGFYDRRDDGILNPQFAHLTGALLGAAEMIGGLALLVRANVLVGAAGLLVLFVLVQTLARGWAAAIAVAAIAISLPEVYFSRGPYSEPFALLLIVGGVALLAADRRPRPAVCWLAGTLLGAAIGSRIDGVLVLAGVIAALVVLRIMDRSGPTTGARFAAMVVGLSTTFVIGILDIRVFSAPYLSDLWSQFHMAAVLAIAMAIAGLAVVIVKEHVPAVSAWCAPRRAFFAWAAGVGVAALLLALWFVRPLTPEVTRGTIDLIGGLQGRQGLPVDPTRKYGEESWLWLVMYLGIPMMLLAVLGAAVLARRSILSRDWRVVGVAAVLGLPTLVYLWRPSITPDHIWAMRRYIPTAWPIIAVTSAVGLTAIASSFSRVLGGRVRSLGTRRVLLIGGRFAAAVVVLVPIVAVTGPYWDHREHLVAAYVIDELCEEISDRPTLLLTDDLGIILTQPVGARCGVPVARLSTVDDASIQEIASIWDGRGEQIVLVSRDPSLETAIATARQVGTVTYTDSIMLRTVEEAPEGLEPGSGNLSTLYLYVIDR